MDNLQLARAMAFKDLHQRSGIFVIPNPWDAGSAKMLTGLGFEALATTSAGLAFSLGKPDGEGAITRDETFENIRAIIAATDLPVAADLENGFGDAPEAIYSFELSVARVEAAVSAAKSLALPFTLTARAENLIYGRNDLTDTIRRLQAYAAAGADVLFAPGLKTREEIELVVKAVAPKPVNVVMGLSNADFTLHELADLGVKRVSLGSSLARAAYGSFFRAAEEISKKGSFGFAREAISYADINALFRS